MCAGRVYTFPKILLVNIIFENLYYGVTSPKRRLLQNTTFSSVMCGSTVSSARPLTIVVTFFHLPGWHQGLVFLTMRVDAERLQSPIIHSASPPPPPPPQFALTVVSKFSWEDCIFRKQYHNIQNLGGKQTDCIGGDSEMVNWLHLKSSKVMKS